MSVLSIGLRGWCAKSWARGRRGARRLFMGGTSRRKARKP